MAETESPTTGQTKRQTRKGRPKKARGAATSSDAARWTVRGVPSNIRDMATRAADERGLTVGDLIGEAITACVRSNSGGNNLPATDSPPDLVETVKAMNERLTAMEERSQPGVLERFWAGRHRAAK